MDACLADLVVFSPEMLWCRQWRRCGVDNKLLLWLSYVLPTAEKNGLSFIETSALDSTNVETAFQTILTGKDLVCVLPEGIPVL